MTQLPGNSNAITENQRRHQNAQRRRRWLPYAGAVLLAALILAGLWPQPAAVETARVSLGQLRATINEEGKTRVKQRYVVSAPVTGQLRRVSVKAGDEAREGMTVLAVIEPLSPGLLDARSRASAEARRDTARANAEKAEAARAFAASELRRFEKLHAEKTVSIQELEAAQWREAAAARELAAAQSALRQAEVELVEFGAGANSRTISSLSPIEVKAPASGRVLRVLEENARVVVAGTPILELGNPVDLEVVIEVLSRDGATIAPGALVELDQWGGSTALAGRVRHVEPAAFTKVSALGVEEQRVNVIADLVTPPEDRCSLGDHFRVEAHIITWETNQVLKAPSGALIRRGQRWAAFVCETGRARLRLVDVGRSSGTETQIISGLKEGDEVILYPGDRIQDGQRIKTISI